MRSWRNFWRWTIPDREVFLAQNGVPDRDVFLVQNGALLLEKQISLWQGRSNPVRHFALGDLQDATSNFDRSRFLGSYPPGLYYWGFLEDRRVVIKAVEDSFHRTRDREDLITEIAILSSFHHRNIVKLVGCCFETEVPLLVYEYVSRRSLLVNLGLWREDGGAKTPSWSTRLRIAMGVADALTYLHCSTSRAVVHRSVAALNIMLDDDYTAKLAGFGFLFPMSQDRESKNYAECLVDSIAGTPAYVDPEHFDTYIVTEKVDVYSFGRLLQDIFTGIPSYERLYGEVPGPFVRIRDMEKRLVNLRSSEKSPVEAYLATKEEYLAMVVENFSGPESSGGKTKQLRALAELALLCCRYRSEERPGMKEVAAELRRINGMELP